MVIGHDHVHAEGGGTFQGRAGTDTVVDGDQQGHPCCGETFHHGHIQSVAVIHAAGMAPRTRAPSRLRQPTSSAVLVIPSAS